MAQSLRLQLAVGDNSLAPLDGASGPEYLVRVQNLLAKVASGDSKACLYVACDTETEVGASFTITCTQADVTNGDKLWVMFPDGVNVAFTAAAAADLTSGTFASITSDNAVAASLNAAINAYQPAQRYMSSTVATNVVTITMKNLGSQGNSVTAKKVVTTSGAFTLSATTLSGGRDASSRATGTFTCTQASIVNNSTTLVGSVTFTWKTSGAAGENQVNIGADDQEAGENLAAAINAHSALKQIVIATEDGAGVVTMTYWCGGREGELVTTTGTAGVVAGAAALATTAAGVYLSDAKQFAFGMPTG